MAHMLLPAGYYVTNDGRVYSTSGWRGKGQFELRQFVHRGYLTVRVTTSKHHRKRFFVHQLVAFYFLEDRPSIKHELRHLDGNPQNNDAGNLAWGTSKQNADDRERHGRTSRGPSHSDAIKRGLEARNE